MIMNQTFPKNIRLNQSRIIREIFSDGEYKSLGLIGVKYKKTGVDSSRFSVSVRKKVGNAPFRSHIKRLLRETIRQKRSILNNSYDFCFFLTNPPKNTLKYSTDLKKIKAEAIEVINQYLKIRDPTASDFVNITSSFVEYQ